jgi:hypothetical protein
MGTAHSQPGLAGSGAEPPASCPMHKGAQTALLGSAAQAAAASSASASAAAAAPAPAPAPAPRGSRFSGPVYNVYSQEIDPKNMMPAPNQAPAPGQSVPLPVERVKSTIPKGGVDGNWLYPSPQMFYNSLVRKKKADNVDASEMNIVVSIHNEMNERTWALLREWEAAHTRCVGDAVRGRTRPLPLTIRHPRPLPASTRTGSRRCGASRATRTSSRRSRASSRGWGTASPLTGTTGTSTAASSWCTT